MDVLGLGDTGPHFRTIGQLILFDEGDVVKVIEEDSGGKETSNAAANDDGMGHDKSVGIRSIG